MNNRVYDKTSHWNGTGVINTSDKGETTLDPKGTIDTKVVLYRLHWYILKGQTLQIPETEMVNLRLPEHSSRWQSSSRTMALRVRSVHISPDGAPPRDSFVTLTSKESGRSGRIDVRSTSTDLLGTRHPLRVTGVRTRYINTRFDDWKPCKIVRHYLLTLSLLRGQNLVRSKWA